MNVSVNHMTRGTRPSVAVRTSRGNINTLESSAKNYLCIYYTLHIYSDSPNRIVRYVVTRLATSPTAPSFIILNMFENFTHNVVRAVMPSNTPAGRKESWLLSRILYLLHWHGGENFDVWYECSPCNGVQRQSLLIVWKYMFTLLNHSIEACTMSLRKPEFGPFSRLRDSGLQILRNALSPTPGIVCEIQAWLSLATYMRYEIQHRPLPS